MKRAMTNRLKHLSANKTDKWMTVNGEFHLTIKDKI